MRRIASLAGEKVDSRATGKNAPVEAVLGDFHDEGIDPGEHFPAPHSRLDGTEKASLWKDGVEGVSDVVIIGLLVGPLALASAHDHVGNRWHESLLRIALPPGETRYSLKDGTTVRAAAAFGELEDDPDDEWDEPAPPRRIRQPLSACLYRERRR
jgi:hypothetical protein